MTGSGEIQKLHILIPDNFLKSGKKVNFRIILTFFHCLLQYMYPDAADFLFFFMEKVLFRRLFSIEEPYTDGQRNTENG